MNIRERKILCIFVTTGEIHQTHSHIIANSPSFHAGEWFRRGSEHFNRIGHIICNVYTGMITLGARHHNVGRKKKQHWYTLKILIKQKD